MFSTLYGIYFSFQMHFKMSSAICFNLGQSKIFSSGNGLRKRRQCLLGFSPKYFQKVSQPFPIQALVFTCLQYKCFGNTVGNEQFHNEQFLLFPVFSTLLENFLSCSSNSKLSSANPFNLEESKISRLGNSSSFPEKTES